MAGQNYLPRHAERTYDQAWNNPIPDRYTQFGISPKLVFSYFRLLVFSFEKGEGNLHSLGTG